jgi:hypothetical protein
MQRSPKRQRGSRMDAQPRRASGQLRTEPRSWALRVKGRSVAGGTRTGPAAPAKGNEGKGTVSLSPRMEYWPGCRRTGLVTSNKGERAISYVFLDVITLIPWRSTNEGSMT